MKGGELYEIKANQRPEIWGKANCYQHCHPRNSSHIPEWRYSVRSE